MSLREMPRSEVVALPEFCLGTPELRLSVSKTVLFAAALAPDYLDPLLRRVRFSDTAKPPRFFATSRIGFRPG